MWFTPHDYQQTAIDKTLETPRCGLFLPMGLGKTAVTLSVIAELLYDRLELGKVLIIAPKKVAESTWQDEMAKWDNFRELTVSTVLGSERQRRDALAADADIYITNRENTVWLMEQYHYQPPFDMLVLDESSSFKNPQAKRFKALRKCRSCFSRMILLTGTPSPNNLMDLWAQLYLLDGGERLGRTLTEYRHNYFKPDKTNGPIVYSYKILGPNAEKEIYRRIGDICLSMKGTVHVPKIINPIPIKLSDKEMALYRKFAKEQVLKIGGEEITASNAAALSNKLLQLSGGAIYDEDGRAIIIHDAKLQRLKEIVEDNAGHPILVFYQYKHELERLLSTFKSARELKTADDLRAWNRGTVPMLLAHPASAGYGLNLQQGGHIIVWYSLTWSLEQYLQANARLCRQGQTETVVIHQLIAKGTVDEAVAQALKRKEAGQQAMLDAIRITVKELS